jgi:PAS domain S-box-containing protein
LKRVSAEREVNMGHAEGTTDFDETDPLTTVLDVIPLAILIVDKTLKIRWVNKGGEEVFGWACKSLVGQSVEPAEGGLWNWPDGQKFREKVQTLFNGGHSISREEHLVTIYGKGESKDHHLRVQASPITFAGDRMILVTLEDMRLPRDSEKETTSTDSLRLMIQMVRATAHELNQPLSVLVGNLDLLTRHPETSEALRNRIDKISKSADHVAAVVRRMQLIIHSSRKPDSIDGAAGESETTSVVP